MDVSESGELLTSALTAAPSLAPAAATASAAGGAGSPYSNGHIGDPNLRIENCGHSVLSTHLQVSLLAL